MRKKQETSEEVQIMEPVLSSKIGDSLLFFPEIHMETLALRPRFW
jgi:hypothetical protein